MRLEERTKDGIVFSRGSKVQPELHTDTEVHFVGYECEGGFVGSTIELLQLSINVYAVQFIDKDSYGQSSSSILSWALKPSPCNGEPPI